MNAPFSRRTVRPIEASKRPRAEQRYWWEFEPSTKSYRHRGTGEEIRFGGPAVVADSGSVWPWYRFDYVDMADGVSYPLLVQSKTSQPEPYGGISQWIDWEKAGLVEYEDRHAYPKSTFRFWRVDHTRSLALWRAGQGDPEALPPYGLWRRADLAIVACALCLPPVTLIGSAPEMVALNGGWLNGEWRDGYYRRATYSWHRAAGADKCAYGPDGRMKPGHADQQFFPIEEAHKLPLFAQCPVWAPGEMQVMWQEPRQVDQLRVVACMREARTGELLFANSWHSHDPITNKQAWALDLHYAGYGIIHRDMTDFRYRPAELVLADPINVSQDFSLCDFTHSVAMPARAKFFEFYDLDLAKTLLPDLKVSPHQVQAGATVAPGDLESWRTLRTKPIGSWRWSFTLHEALLHALPFTGGFDLGGVARKARMGERATFDLKSGEIGCKWLYETTVRLAPRLESDGARPGWEPLFD